MNLKTNRFAIVSVLLLIALIVPLQNNAAAISISPAVQTVLKQAEQSFIKTGASINQVSSEDPAFLAIMMGLILQRQNIYINQRRNIEEAKKFEALGYEVMNFLDQLAKHHKYRDPSDGTELPAEKLRAMFLNAYKGNFNQLFIRDAGIDPAKLDVPFMVSQVQLPPDTDKPDNGDGGHARLQIKKEKGGITLLGETAGEKRKKQVVNGVPFIDEVICPTNIPPEDQLTHGYYDIEHGNNLKTRCSYWENLLNSQLTYVEKSPAKSTNHGTHFQFHKTNNSIYMTRSTDYRNGLIDGIDRVYGYSKKFGVYLSKETEYQNDVKNGRDRYWTTKYGRSETKPYLIWDQYYKYGKLAGRGEYYTVNDDYGYFHSKTVNYFNGKRDREEINYYRDVPDRTFSVKTYKNNKLIHEVRYDRNGKLDWQHKY